MQTTAATYIADLKQILRLTKLLGQKLDCDVKTSEWTLPAGTEVWIGNSAVAAFFAKRFLEIEEKLTALARWSGTRQAEQCADRLEMYVRIAAASFTSEIYLASPKKSAQNDDPAAFLALRYDNHKAVVKEFVRTSEFLEMFAGLAGLTWRCPTEAEIYKGSVADSVQHASLVMSRFPACVALHSSMTAHLKQMQLSLDAANAMPSWQQPAEQLNLAKLEDSKRPETRLQLEKLQECLNKAGGEVAKDEALAKQKQQVLALTRELQDYKARLESAQVKITHLTQELSSKTEAVREAQNNLSAYKWEVEQQCQLMRQMFQRHQKQSGLLFVVMLGLFVAAVAWRYLY